MMQQVTVRVPASADLKLFAVSGTRPEEMNITVGPTGVNRWFQKPLNPKALIDALRDELHIERVLV